MGYNKKLELIAEAKSGIERDLKPCPFCGNEFPILRYFGNTDTYEVQCNHCQTMFGMDCTAGHDRKKNLLIDAWNRRADEV